MKTPEQLAEEAVEKTGYRLKRSVVDGTIMLRQGMDRQLKRQAFLNGFLAGYRAAKNQFADAGKVVNPSNNSNSWISVKDRLPEDGQDVLACVNGQVLISYVHGMKGFSNEWGLAENGETIWPSHWMPLPEPPGKV